jgi:hypothetical protein
MLTPGCRLAAPETAQGLLDGLAAAVTELLARAGQTETAAHTVAEVAQLEAEVPDLKIADRANEILAQPGGVEPAGVNILHQYVRRVLEGADSGSALNQQSQALRMQVQDRKLVSAPRRSCRPLAACRNKKRICTCGT